MNVTYAGWNIEHGCFHCDIFVDETKTDYEIHYANGNIAKQTSPFDTVTTDWNNDGDVYSMFGAWFGEVENDGKIHRSTFWSVEDLVQAAADALDPNASCMGQKIIAIPGIEIPPLEKRPSLEEKIRQSELRAMHQDAERNRKMDMLGIRPSNEPWAK